MYNVCVCSSDNNRRACDVSDVCFIIARRRNLKAAATGVKQGAPPVRGPIWVNSKHRIVGWSCTVQINTRPGTTAGRHQVSSIDDDDALRKYAASSRWELE